MQKKGEDLSSVLYIEDDSINWEIVSLFLKGQYRVDTASDSSEALAKIKMNKYDIVLLGLELAKEIRKIKNYKHTPIIAVTAHASREDERRILGGACSHYISKPFTKKVLIETLMKALPK